MTPYGKKQHEARIEMATQMFKRGRDIPSVKKITNLTLAALKRAGLIFEVIIPDPRGYVEDQHGNRTHNGDMLHTDKWRPMATR